MSTRPTYRDYRSYGHGPLGALTLATPMWVALLIGFVTGVLVSFFL
jgi:cytochrome b